MTGSTCSSEVAQGVRVGIAQGLKLTTSSRPMIGHGRHGLMAEDADRVSQQ